MPKSYLRLNQVADNTINNRIALTWMRPEGVSGTTALVGNQSHAQSPIGTADFILLLPLICN